MKNPSFLSLPDEIILNCLARISRSYYPKLSLVCKTFRSLIVSNELQVARVHLKTFETLLHVCLQFPDDPCPSWFILWIKPGHQILTNQLEKKTTSTQNIQLVPSSYCSDPPWFFVYFGSETYALSQCSDPSSIMYVTNDSLLAKDVCLWRNAPNMTVPRARASAVVFNGKVYVMGGCAADDLSANWGEVFDPKTQTWEPLPDPGAELRFTSIRKIEVMNGKIYIRSNEKKDSVYDPNYGKWNVTEKAKSYAQCFVNNIWYYCDKQSCYWYDSNRKEWRVVRGLAIFNKKNQRGGSMIEISPYGGKLVILWDKFIRRRRQHKNIWGAVIALERREDVDEVWGTVEWANIVLKVPSSYVFLHSLLNKT